MGDGTGMENVIVRPRSKGDPEPDLTRFRLIHRSMRGEVRKLAALTAAQGDAPFPPEQEAALRRLLGFLCTEIHAHHTKEDDILWPLISASAGEVVDLLPLTRDHGQIDPYLHRIRTGTGRDRAEALASLRDLLDEHITEEEKLVFPVMLEYVSAEDFERCEKQFQKGAPLSQMKILLPWLVSYTTPEEKTHLLQEAGFVLRLMLRIFEPGYLRLQRAVYGS